MIEVIEGQSNRKPSKNCPPFSVIYGFSCRLLISKTKEEVLQCFTIQTGGYATGYMLPVDKYLAGLRQLVGPHIKDEDHRPGKVYETYKDADGKEQIKRDSQSRSGYGTLVGGLSSSKGQSTTLLWFT